MSRLRPLVAGTLLGAAFLCSTAIAQQAPRTISYQGYATNASGGPVADGSYAMVFTIYNNANGGSALWSESQNVEVRKGLFGVVFGESTPLALPFDNPYWLGVRLQPSDPEMNPRTQFTASPYSIRSLMADSAMAVAPNSVTTVSIAPGAVTLDKLDASGSRAGQVLTSTGSGLAWADPSTVTGVNTLNGLNGDVEIVGGPSTSVTVEGNKVKIGLLGGGAITSVNSVDAAIAVTNGTGPSVTLSIVPGGISTYLITDEAVTTAKLAPGAVTQDKLAPGLVINPSGPAGGDLAGTYPNPMIAPNAVNSGKILDGSIQNADLANSSITINPGIGMSGGGVVPLGGSVTIDNAGVTGLVGTPNQVNVSAPNGVVTLSTPQDIDPAATPTFNNMNLTGKANSASTVIGDPGNTLVTKDYLVSGNIGVATNPSLVGDGTTGNPLGINLANPNTYTATQSLPATAAQGDNLIASVNAGTTTVNDAHVADNLTIVSGSITTTPITASPISGSTITASAISGSTISTSIISTSPIDNSPIGATTPNTGAFTTINGASLALTGKGTSASTVLADPGNTLVTKDYLVAGNIGVVTNPSLVGDGTTGNPLGINLANPNTFTATQTLPVSAAQGDALIASTNAGAATVNAVRIGNGLTDAQVNDNLTINGGTVDNSPIGATTPNTGAFTSINGTSLALTGKGTSASTVAADPGNTLLTKDFVTTPGNVAVSTNASLVGDGTTATPLGINLANANTFTATQTLPVSAAQGDALIASTNAGTTTVDAVRIGNGLTNAQVNDDLTINGGTVDNSPIGATTPSTAAFTTIDGASLALTAQGTSASTLVTDPGNTLVTKDYLVAGNLAVSTDATLVGDGTTATPLGLNTANANTFTATQTLPVSAAQGDNLIASANAGTTMIDDAHVADNLTVNGGTVDNSPIGATTPNTGAFTSIDGASLALTAQGTSASTLVTDPGNTLVTKDYLVAGNLAVSTDATLVGDGTTATPLGLNTANANTFTATQTLPVSAAQGDALIASTNAGTTTVDAVRIGNGLTNAQVNDDLTINGGTVDNSPIGATTPNTGAFTSIDGASLALTAQGTSASTLVTDPGNTLVTKDYLVAGNLAVSTDATLVGDGTTATPLGLNTANANTFTATQTLPVSAAQGDNLIASANAGTTTIDDAHVADNLTVNGGTVDNSPIGATTPNTGAFTSIDGASLALTAQGTSASTLVTDPGNTLVTKDYLVAGNLAVSTDATLVGDGTTATPLGLNTANANTFTATQTLPVSAAQGDNLIASTNAGTTTVDAVRIGNGLTNAQVNDDLTINGGTVDNSPIGATTPNTGAFTSIDGASLALTAQGTSASTLVTDPGNTLVTKDYLVAGNLAVSTDATLVGDGTTATPLGLNTANANTFTATQTLPVSAAQGDNLIASANAGTTTIDDAHVADNLTVNGGTVNNSPIGATTPSTGAFTTIGGTSLALTAKGTSASTTAGDGGTTLVTKDYLVAGNLAVSTDATLVGDGTTATPLGINLANANTFTATQTLPATNAQGDALMTSVNAGTATVDAARIGNGLTDAQVLNNLTISAGTVNSTPIGATTPSTGAFTTIGGTSLALTAKGTSASTTAGDGGTTLVTKDYLVAGNLAVSTDATLVGDGTTATPLGINLANANTFTATQTLPATNAQGDALITSVNAGSTTINASQIGNGLTDAQVLNNLTISAGTVNSTPIGATTPSTGAFTTIGGTSLALTAKGTSASTTAGDGGTTLVTKDYLVAGNLAVSTDATLVGDGTTATPLGINLANPNTFTATQTLPATNAQGDALMTSVNAGTGTVDAARIGNGLTDAQVLNNLTISAGTVNSTPIGATTPSTGAFTTIGGTSLALTAKGTSASTTAGDGGTTLVTKDYLVAGNLAVSTDATLVGDGTTATPLGINLANANTFTATQTLPATNAQGDVLITSVNAGSTTINASQIGNGLTDAQVNNNLTISAGTVNSTPIGATTPSTGAFTTIGGTSLALTAKGTSASTTAGDGGTTLVTKDYLVAGNLAVSTDATMTGNGTTATPLGINLANANTFTATQTLPATNAQGDVLITSVNAGSTTINASQIGNGLTDAQVLNNLTISAGTVNNTPIGATTPSTGVFTTIGGTSLALTAKATSASTAVGDGGTTLVTKDYLASGNLAVTTDATLTGNGTTLTPLGINTANANTYTATQTFPTSNAQGDALIASTNSGTTTINASRIGTGLTDAQVNNNLTIAAGTINSTPIGATTPSTGAFTTINGTSLTLTAKATSAATTAGDGATTLVTKGYVETAGNVAVMTDGTMSGDGTSGLPLGINVANANSWSATQTFPTSNAQGDALIASTNSGTTSILATRIGNGLTDAQVLNNLTISGGTVNNSPIGATTPSTGVFEYASTADENAAVRGTATQATTNQSIGVWGDASSAGATNTGTIAVLATGNGNATAGQTNVAIQINDGEFAIGRGSTAPSVGTVVEAAAGGTAYSAAGPSGVIELTLGGGNLTTAAPTAGTFQDLGTLTINNRYVTTESIIHVTVVSKVDEGTAPNPESAVYMLDVDNRAAGSFVLRIGMIPTATNGSNYQNTDAIRVGYTVVNPSK